MLGKLLSTKYIKEVIYYDAKQFYKNGKSRLVDLCNSESGLWALGKRGQIYSWLM